MDNDQIAQAVKFLSKSNKALAEANSETLKMIEGLKLSNELIIQGNQQLAGAMKMMVLEIEKMQERIVELESRQGRIVVGEDNIVRHSGDGEVWVDRD